MIRTLNFKDRESVLEYVQEEKDYNQYILGYLNNYGFEEEHLTFWGEMDSNNKLIGVLMKYYNDFVFYSKDSFDVKGFSDVIMRHDFQVLAGKKDVAQRFQEYINFKCKFDTYFSVQESCNYQENEELLTLVKKMQPDNLNSIISLYNEIEEFENNETDNTSLRQRIKDGCGRGYYIEINGEAAAAVQTTAEYEEGAMIVSVSTSPRHRRKGYVTACLYKLCKELAEENKKVFLYYYNKEAGRIYSKLGFKEIGIWSRYLF